MILSGLGNIIFHPFLRIFRIYTKNKIISFINNCFLYIFRIQPHSKTRERQLSTWADLVQNYQKYRNQALINITEETPLFYNESIKRKLPLDGIILVLEELSKIGHSSPVDKNKTQWEIYWHTLDEWGNIIYDWATENGMTNTVCTIFELIEGENSVGQEFHGLDQSVIIKALKILEDKGKCELMLFDDSEGVKFF